MTFIQNTKVDLNKVKINCSDLSTLMVCEKEMKPLSESQELELIKLKSLDKPRETQLRKIEKYENKIALGDIGDSVLTEASKKMLLDVYVKEKYGKKVVNASKDYNIGLINGSLSEFRSLELVSNLTGESFKVNKDLVSNKYIKGRLDAYIGKSIKNANKVIEIKTAQNMQSLLSMNAKSDLAKIYYWQLMGYMYLTKADIAEIYHVVVTYDSNIIKESINRYLNRVKGMGLTKDKIEQEVESIRFNLTFDDIPPNERMIKVSLERNDSDIDRIKTKVTAARRYLIEFDKIHTSMNK